MYNVYNAYDITIGIAQLNAFSCANKKSRFEGHSKWSLVVRNEMFKRTKYVINVLNTMSRCHDTGVWDKSVNPRRIFFINGISDI